ncbi:MAG TPA: hypothetical protein VM491_03215, partial [Burkholderiaceae bacterium]|nr:hypothetical protein [Burkholderiaceae bacterium]
MRQHRERARFSGFPPAIAPADLAGAYRTQDALVAAKARVCGPPAGWKIALSNPAMQRLVGL